MHRLRSGRGDFRGCRDARRGLPPDERPADDELASLAGAGAMGLDAAAVQLGQTLDQRQADAQPIPGTLPWVLGSDEQAENARQHFWRDTNACVPNPDYSFVALSYCRKPDVAPLRGIKGGVVQEVGQDLLQAG